MGKDGEGLTFPHTWHGTFGKGTCIAFEVLRSVQPLLTSPCHLDESSHHRLVIW